MTVIGITGPSGAGKGALSRIMADKYGFIVLNADEIYHDLVSAPSECLDEIREYFGDAVISPDRSLDRRALSGLVFGDQNQEKLEHLNMLTHKHVVKKIEELIASYEGKVPACIIDAPLLIEAGICPRCDFTVCVIADKNIRVDRIVKRDGISHDAAIKRIDSQKSDDFYVSNTDYCITNNQDIEAVYSSICKILSERRVI